MKYPTLHVTAIPCNTERCTYALGGLTLDELLQLKTIVESSRKPHRKSMPAVSRPKRKSRMA